VLVEVDRNVPKSQRKLVTEEEPAEIKLKACRAASKKQWQSDQVFPNQEKP
jgi:hypothetical protein